MITWLINGLPGELPVMAKHSVINLADLKQLMSGRPDLAGTR